MLTEAEKRLCDLMWEIAPNDKDFRLFVVLSCRVDNLTGELVDYIETNRITDWRDLEKWFDEKYITEELEFVGKAKVREAVTVMLRKHAARKNLRVIKHRQKHLKS